MHSAGVGVKGQKRHESAFSALVVASAMPYFGRMKRELIIRDVHGLDSELAALEGR
jgi:hypothetical protein